MELIHVIRYFLLLGATGSTEHDSVFLKAENVLLETVVFGLEVANIFLDWLLNKIGIVIFIILSDEYRLCFNKFGDFRQFHRYNWLFDFFLHYILLFLNLNLIELLRMYLPRLARQILHFVGKGSDLRRNQVDLLLNRILIRRGNARLDYLHLLVFYRYAKIIQGGLYLKLIISNL